MADTEPMFLAFWGDIRLFVSSMQYQGGNTQVVHNLASGGVHPVQPRGPQLKTARLQLLFDDFDGASETGVIAMRRFQSTLQERRLFFHPVDGSYFAVIGDFEPSIDENSVCTAMCEFIPDGEVRLVSPTAFNLLLAGGQSSVAQAADRLRTDMDDLNIGFPPESMDKMDFTKPLTTNVNLGFSTGISANVSVSANVSASATASASVSASVSASLQLQASASAMAFASVYAQAITAAQVTAVAQISGMASGSAFALAYAHAALDADARASVAAWTDDDDAARRSSVDAARLTSSIDGLIESGEFESNLELWPAYRSAVMLGDAITAAAIAASSETASVFVMRIQDRTSLLPLAARIYGGAEADDRARQIAALNDIKTRGWIDPGDYLMPARTIR